MPAEFYIILQPLFPTIKLEWDVRNKLQVENRKKERVRIKIVEIIMLGPVFFIFCLPLPFDLNFSTFPLVPFSDFYNFVHNFKCEL